MATVDISETTALPKTTETAVSEAATVKPKTIATGTTEAPAEATATMLTVATLNADTSTTKAAPGSKITMTLEDHLTAKSGTTMAHLSPILSSEATKAWTKQLSSTAVLREALSVAKLCSNALRGIRS